MKSWPAQVVDVKPASAPEPDLPHQDIPGTYGAHNTTRHNTIANDFELVSKCFDDDPTISNYCERAQPS